jgi:hypothetical protein
MHKNRPDLLGDGSLILHDNARPPLGKVLTDLLSKYVGISNSSQTGSKDHQPMAVRECVRYGRKQGTLPLSMASGVTL